ncbi:PLP-dependent cysteine synthase family protein [Ruania halotolerans]|uniref:PLP-dependent cysteine synthase family protein n=1 Tax=Ruania halotolerans TaxID=2897773 RepID=UPI001E5FEAA5|nr:PLP-dependent cysteine synthase family protein [Ruania halotolerans]UFU05857.1 PLP-dependent cysteine synthase family protein [Ruania halotolerans]
MSAAHVRHSTADRAWCDDAIRKVQADAQRSADTHLHQLMVPEGWGVDVYLKDESVHPTGSLKHRLARSLFLYALANGWLTSTSTVIEATSGNTAVSEAYFARMLGLPYIAVMPRSTSASKVARIEAYGGRCHYVDAAPDIYAEAERLAAETGGHYLDQFTYAERATDWRGNNNIAESIFEQLSAERHPVPTWIVAAAGTGGTSSTIGRYLRYKRYPTRLLVVDPENSAYYPGWADGVADYSTGMPSRIEGIGRPRTEASFIPSVIDEMIPVPDAASIAAMRHLDATFGRRAGPSTGTCLWGVWSIVDRMRRAGETGSIVSLICDSGDLYTSTYYDDAWVADKGLDPAPYLARLGAFFEGGTLA